jgi:alanine dehydrogenase
MAFMMLVSARQESVQTLKDKNITAIAYELIEDDSGGLPVLYPLSQIGGRMTAQIAAHYLQNDKGSNGILLGGITGVPAAEVVILGAGVVGINATQAFLGMGARVTLMDNDLQKLQAAHDRFAGQVTTMVSHDFNLMHVCGFADVLIGAVQVPRQRTPRIVTREMVRSMHAGSLIIDLDIDQGGSIETSRPTHHDQPTYVAEQVVHYCVPNVPGVVGRTSTHAFLNAAWPFIELIAAHGIEASLEQSAALRRGLVA